MRIRFRSAPQARALGGLRVFFWKLNEGGQVLHRIGALKGWELCKGEGVGQQVCRSLTAGKDIAGQTVD